MSSLSGVKALGRCEFCDKEILKEDGVKKLDRMFYKSCMLIFNQFTNDYPEKSTYWNEPGVLLGIKKLIAERYLKKISLSECYNEDMGKSLSTAFGIINFQYRAHCFGWKLGGE